jgi:hypothetical protein
MMRRVLVTVMVFLAIMLAACGNYTFTAGAAPGPGASPNPIPAMTLTLYPSGKMAYPTIVAPGVAIVEGALTMDKIPGERLVASLTSTVDVGWAVACSPPFLLFSNNKVSFFTATVVVPKGTSVSQVGTLTIHAEATSQSFRLRTMSQMLVTVAPYYYFYVNSPMPYRETAPAKPVIFDVQIDNWGNAEDSYDIAVQNIDELADKGWTVAFSTSTAARVSSMHARVVRMSVQPAFSSTLYKAVGTPIDVIATSQGSRDGEPDNPKTAVLQFIVYERGTYIDPGAAGSAGLSIMLISLVVFPLLVRVRRLRKRHKRNKLARARNREPADEQQD